jgi:hypothetical protein
VRRFNERPGVVVVGNEGVAEGLQVGQGLRLPVWAVSHFFNVWWNRSTFPQVVGWFSRECFCVTPRQRSSAEKPLMVSST